MNKISNKLKVGTFILSVLMLFCFIGINSVNAATEYTPLVHKDDYDFTVNSGCIEEWFTYTAEGEVTSHIIQAASSYSGTPYSSMDCAQFVAKVLLDAGSIDFGGYLACDGNMQVAEFLKLFAGEIPTGIDGRTVSPVKGSEVIDAASMSSQFINEWCAVNCKPADILVFYGEDGNDLHIGIFSEVRDGVAYMWHSGSSRGVCEIAVSNIIRSGKVGHTITYMQSFRASADTKAYTTLWINKIAGDGNYMGGAEYGVYSDQGLTNEIGRLIDDNYNGTLSTPFELTRDGSDFVGTFYIKEIVAPTQLLTGNGSIDLTCGEGGLPDEYNFLDDTVYKVDMRISGVNGSAGTMNYTVSKITGAGEEQMYNDVIYDYPLTGSEIIVGNQPYSGSGMVDAPVISLEKTTVTSFDTTNTVFTLKSSYKLVATYSYENGKWIWKDKNGNDWGTGSFPVKANTEYTIEESSILPEFSCYDGNKIVYQVVNNGSGWNQTSENTYEMSFSTGGLGDSLKYEFSAQNDTEEALFSLTKDVVEANDTKDGFQFELWNTEGSILLAKGESDASGKVLWDTGNLSGAEEFALPAGQYQLRELIPENKTYGASKAVYTYDVPSGFSTSSDGSYWYKTIFASSGTTIAQNISNDRCQASIKVTKIAQDGKDEGLEFEIYYGGNGEEPVWSYETVETAVTDSDGYAVFEELPLGWYKIKENVPENYKGIWVGKYNGIYKEVRLTEANDNQTVGVTALNLINTQIIIEKTDAWTGETISSYTGSPVKFRVYEDNNGNGILDGKEAESYIEITDSDLDGVLRVEDVEYGCYLLEEQYPPCGYYKTEDLIQVIVDSAEKVQVTVPQVPYAETAVILKTDSITGKPVKEAEFTVYADTNNDGIHQDNEPEALTFDQASGSMRNAAVTEVSDGKYESDPLLAGNYVIVETGLPDGYFYCGKDGKSSSEANSFAFTVVPEDTEADGFCLTSKEFDAMNVPGGVVVYKVNDSGELLEGAAFSVFEDKACSKLAGILNDEGNGCYSYYGLGAGTYYLMETNAPEGYICDKTVYKFVINSDKSTAVITNAFAYELGKEDSFCDPVPITGTVLIDTSSEDVSKTKLLSYGEKVELTDYVACSGLNEGETYKLTGTLVKKSNGEELLTTETEFIADSAFMTVEVGFKIDTTELYGEAIVAFEVLEDQDGNEYRHEDIDDEAQTLTMPQIGTSASDAETGTNVFMCSDIVSIIDEVSYEGLTKDLNYKVTGMLMDKSTGEPVKDKEGNPVVAETDFTVTSTSGSVTVEFENVCIPYEITEVVVFEKLYADDVLLAVHEDIEDEEQTIVRAQLETNAEAENTGKALMPDTVATIVDTVEYSGLIPGTCYVIEATLYKSTGEQLTANGQPIINCVEFIPDTADGTISVPVTFDTQGLKEGEVIVVFESVKDVATQEEKESGQQQENVEVSRHTDLSSKSQSLTVKALPATGEDISRYAVTGAITVFAGGVIAVIVFLRTKKKEE